MGKQNPISISKSLKKEAEHVIYKKGINDILNSYGDVFYTGSYHLDLMIWPDIDIYMVLKPDPYSINAFFQLGSKIAALPGVFSMKFNNCITLPLHETAPKGLYWKTYIDRGKVKKPWKIDLWAFSPETIEKSRKEMREILKRLDKRKRKQIIELKHSLLTKDGRTPIFSGYYIYQAILFKNMKKRKDIIDYLKKHGVNVEE